MMILIVVFLLSRYRCPISRTDDIKKMFPRVCLHSARRLVEEHAVGKRITSVVAVEQGGGPRCGLFDEIIFSNCSCAKAAEDALVGRTVVAVKRCGKHMWWQLSDGGPHLLCHFGMTGSISLKAPGQHAITAKYKSFSVDAKNWPPKFTKVEVLFADGTRLAL